MMRQSAATMASVTVCSHIIMFVKQRQIARYTQASNVDLLHTLLKVQGVRAASTHLTKAGLVTTKLGPVAPHICSKAGKLKRSKASTASASSLV